MIESIFIKNFKKFDRKTIKIDQHNIIIGEKMRRFLEGWEKCIRLESWSFTGCTAFAAW